jgi:DNA (cytosine-5)-methyltransferase 1
LKINSSLDNLFYTKDSDVNTSPQPENSVFNDLSSVVSSDAPEEIYISPTACYGIVRRKNERKLRINPRLEEVLLGISSAWTMEDIERRSRIQKRGRFSDIVVEDVRDTTAKEQYIQYDLFSDLVAINS